MRTHPDIGLMTARRIAGSGYEIARQQADVIQLCISGCVGASAHTSIHSDID